MSDALTIALIAAFGGLGAAGVTLLVQLMRRVARLEDLNRKLWAWNRDLVDHIYKGKPPPPPGPPDLTDLFEGASA